MRIGRLAEARSAHGAGRARRWRAAALALLLAAGLPRLRAQSADTPPPVPRELRAVWIATVGNIDWPSRPGLDAAAQQRELLTLLDRAVALHLNTVIFQVRPQADAVYASALEPWSPFLTGVMGRPPSPFYDPLAFLVREAHARGLAVHAWINPYRALHPASPGPPAATHVSRRAPALVRRYGRYLWMDPGDPAVREAVRRVVVDIVRRYDVDGIHIDDYFYPYPERDAAGRVIAFPDDSAWAAFRAGGGMLDRADWRRQNVDALVLELSDAVHRTKPFVLFGVSPFGIWRPGHPPGVTGFDAYEAIYANSRRWLRRGWVDYLAPQLYWPIEQPGQSYPALLAWWAAQNPARRHLWPGLNASLAARMPPGGRGSAELLDQIARTRATAGASGEIFFSMRTLMQDPDSLDERLVRGAYAAPALVPASPWLDARKPPAPAARVAPDSVSGTTVLALAPGRGAGRGPWLWVVQTRTAAGWTTAIVPGGVRQQVVAARGAPRPLAVVVRAVNRVGTASEPVVATERAWPR